MPVTLVAASHLPLAGAATAAPSAQRPMPTLPALDPLSRARERAKERRTGSIDDTKPAARGAISPPNSARTRARGAPPSCAGGRHRSLHRTVVARGDGVAATAVAGQAWTSAIACSAIPLPQGTERSGDRLERSHVAATRRYRLRSRGTGRLPWASSSAGSIAHAMASPIISLLRYRPSRGCLSGHGVQGGQPGGDLGDLHLTSGRW